MPIQTDGVIPPAPDVREWWPVRWPGRPWLHGKPTITFARTYVVEQGPHLLRVADGE
jgi:hypothetical protein